MLHLFYAIGNTYRREYVVYVFVCVGEKQNERGI